MFAIGTPYPSKPISIALASSTLPLCALVPKLVLGWNPLYGELELLDIDAGADGGADIPGSYNPFGGGIWLIPGDWTAPTRVENGSVPLLLSYIVGRGEKESL